MFLKFFLNKMTIVTLILCLVPSYLKSQERTKTDSEFTDAMNKGIIYASKGDNPRALARFKEAVRLKPRSAEAYARLALTYCDRGMYIAAEENATKATLINGKSFFAWLVLGTAQFYSNKNKLAINSLNKALRFNPNNPHITYTLGRCYYYLGNETRDVGRNKTKALEYFKQTLILSPSYIEAKFMEGCCFLDLGMPDVARDSFTTALRANPDNVEIHFRLGICAVKTERLVEAERQFRKALRLNPQYYEANLHLANLFMEHLPDKEQAILYYKKYLATAPHDHPMRAKVMNIIKENSNQK